MERQAPTRELLEDMLQNYSTHIQTEGALQYPIANRAKLAENIKTKYIYRQEDASNLVLKDTDCPIYVHVTFDLMPEPAKINAVRLSQMENLADKGWKECGMVPLVLNYIPCQLSIVAREQLLIYDIARIVNGFNKGVDSELNTATMKDHATQGLHGPIVDYLKKVPVLLGREKHLQALAYYLPLDQTRTDSNFCIDSRM